MGGWHAGVRWRVGLPREIAASPPTSAPRTLHAKAVEHDLAAVAGNLIPAQPVLQAVPGGQTGSGGSGGGGWRQRLLLCRLVSQACGCELQSVQFRLQLFILLPQALQLLLGSGLRKWCRHAAAMAPVAGGNAY